MSTLYIVAGAPDHDICATEREYFFTLDRDKAVEVRDRLCALPAEPWDQLHPDGPFVAEGQQRPDGLDGRVVLRILEVELDQLPYELMSDAERRQLHEQTAAAIAARHPAR